MEKRPIWRRSRPRRIFSNLPSGQFTALPPMGRESRIGVKDQNQEQRIRISVSVKDQSGAKDQKQCGRVVRIVSSGSKLWITGCRDSPTQPGWVFWPAVFQWFCYTLFSILNRNYILLIFDKVMNMKIPWFDWVHPVGGGHGERKIWAAVAKSSQFWHFLTACQSAHVLISTSWIDIFAASEFLFSS